jgi:hypothetical protein
MGDNGDDALLGRAGDDVLFGGSGDDSLRGFTGRDILNGSFGTDTLLGNGNEDIVIAGRLTPAPGMTVLEHLLAIRSGTSGCRIGATNNASPIRAVTSESTRDRLNSVFLIGENEVKTFSTTIPTISPWAAQASICCSQDLETTCLTKSIRRSQKHCRLQFSRQRRTGSAIPTPTQATTPNTRCFGQNGRHRGNEG